MVRPPPPGSAMRVSTAAGSSGAASAVRWIGAPGGMVRTEVLALSSGAGAAGVGGAVVAGAGGGVAACPASATGSADGGGSLAAGRGKAPTLIEEKVRGLGRGGAMRVPVKPSGANQRAPTAPHCAVFSLTPRGGGAKSVRRDPWPLGPRTPTSCASQSPPLTHLA